MHEFATGIELRELRAERDAALLHLPAGCGSLADAAATLRQERDDLQRRLTAGAAALLELRKMLSDAECALRVSMQRNASLYDWLRDLVDKGPA